jgi:hypothetical protein
VPPSVITAAAVVDGFVVSVSPDPLLLSLPQAAKIIATHATAATRRTVRQLLFK